MEGGPVALDPACGGGVAPQFQLRHVGVTVRARFPADSGRGRRYGGSVEVLDGLNPEQRRAAEAVRGPVCILAGAGLRQDDDDHPADRLAGRLRRVPGRPDPRGDLHRQGRRRDEVAARGARRDAASRRARSTRLRSRSSTATPRTRSGGSCRRRRCFCARSRTRCRRRTSSGRRATSPPRSSTPRRGGSDRMPTSASLDGHEPPIPANLMHTVYREYERRKAQRGEIDFEDLLELAIRLFETDEQARADLRDRYRAFTVDEYQDVNLLQQTLLDLWLGPRDDLCVVGDDYQSIYAFTGRLAAVAARRVEQRFPHAAVVRLEENYRSSPQVLELANRLVPRLGGRREGAAGDAAAGPEPVLRPFATRGGRERVARRASFAARRRAGVPLEEAAILCRTNARLADFEEVLHEAGCRFRARRSWRATRRGGCSALLDRDSSTDVAAPCSRARARGGLARGAARQARRPRADAPGRPRAARQAGRGARRRRAHVRRVRGGAATAVRSRRRGRPRRAPAHLPPREGARVRGGVPAAARREGAAVAPGAHGGGAGRGAAAALRRHHAGEAAARDHVVAASEPVPRRARRDGVAAPAAAARAERAAARTSRRRPRRSGAGASSGRAPTACRRT